jgi:fructosamine-3-kinase
MFSSESEGLRALRAAGIRAPEPLGHGVRNGQAYIEMEHLALGATPDWPALGRMVAALHRNTAARFGWQTDNWIGLAPQENGWDVDWSRFFLEKRLKPQAARCGMLDALPDVSKILEGHRPQASLLHGDLWNGNAGFTPEGPVLFDPAVYYGDREADLAMTELFGGFPAAFYAAYRKALPVDAGYETRKHLYNLYHLLNHLNLFGSGYLGQVNATLRLLRERLQ